MDPQFSKDQVRMAQGADGRTVDSDFQAWQWDPPLRSSWEPAGFRPRRMRVIAAIHDPVDFPVPDSVAVGMAFSHTTDEGDHR